MDRKLNLTVKKPCSENFNNFQSTQAGGFCQSCQKDVIDFTEMTDREIFQFFENRPKNTCGRFSAPQLKTYHEGMFAKQKPNYHWLGAGLLSFSLLTLLPTKRSSAQSASAMNKTHISQTTSAEKGSESQKQHSEKGHKVEGVVTGEDGSTFPSVVILLKGTHSGVFTDVDGKFKFEELLKAGDELIFSYLGYETQSYVIPKDAPEEIFIEMKFKDSHLEIMGEVAIEQVYSSKSTFWQRVKNKFK